MKNLPDACEPIDNPSANPRFADLLDAPVTRRRMLQGAALLPLLGLLPGCASTASPSGAPSIGFTPVPVSGEDTVRVPAGYTARALYAWGDATGDARGMPAFRQDATNTADDQLLQAGMHHDGMHYFPLDSRTRNERGLLAINHEYTDDGLLHPGGMVPWTAEKVRKAQHAHGVSIVEVARDGGNWNIVRPSRYARRITAATPMRVSGPAAGHALLRTADDPTGTRVLGTLNNCANGYTPWGTYLTCEENWNNYFANRGTPTTDERRYGVGAKSAFRWEEHDARFDAAAHPHEPHRFGWVVEIDPYDPAAVPVKRTALGRIKHEGAMMTTTRDGRVVIYMGDDQQFEYVYKFVSRDAWTPGNRAANATVLDHGTLYVARFDADGRGAWLALEHGRNGLDAARGFADQAAVLVKTRQAADVVGATKMDRPEWIAVHPQTGEVYCALTNNTARGAANQAGPDAANPRAANSYGHIVRWQEDGDAAATTFRWNVFLLAGDPTHADAAKRGTVVGDGFGSPDGLWFDADGRLWIQTDVSTSALGRGDYAQLGNNQMLCADVRTGRVARFLTGPRGCEVTGITATPDGRTLFVNIQHPGEPANERNDPARPTAISTWPDGARAGRPRSATVVITKDDGGVIGS